MIVLKKHRAMIKLNVINDLYNFEFKRSSSSRNYILSSCNVTYGKINDQSYLLLKTFLYRN